MAKNSQIVAVFDDLTEFFAFRPIMDKLNSIDLPVDIIVPYDSGYNGLAEHTMNKIKELGYTVKTDAPKNKTYKILLTPYPGLDVVKRIKYIYHIQYSYGGISPKPNPTYLPECKMGCDAIISHDIYDEDFFRAYGAVIHTIPNWRYHNFKHDTTEHSKPILLILPTFGPDTSSINHYTDKAIRDIKEHFTVITKAHHAIHFGIDGEKTFDKLKSLADEFYDSDCPIDTLLKKADIVLSDNSGAIFDAMYAEVPVALFAKDINVRKLGPINTLQYKLVKRGIIPYTDNPDQILHMLLNIHPYIKKQLNVKKELFPPDSKNPINDYIAIIKHYLSLDANEDYRKYLHDSFIKEWHDDKSTIKDQAAKIAELTQQNEELSKYISDIHNSTSWKITKPLRKIKSPKDKHVEK